MTTLAEARTAVLERIGYDNAGMFTPAQLNAMINASAVDLHLILQGMAPDLQYATNVTRIDVVADEDTYQLPACFQNPIRVQWQFNGLGIPLRRFEMADAIALEVPLSWSSSWPPRYNIGFSLKCGNRPAITFLPSPDAAHTVAVVYRETAPQWSNDTDFLQLYPEWLIRDVIVKCTKRLRKDATEEIAERERLTALISNSFILSDEANAARVVDVYSLSDAQPYMWR